MIYLDPGRGWLMKTCLMKKIGSTCSTSIWGLLWRNPKVFLILISFRGCTCTSHFRFELLLQCKFSLSPHFAGPAKWGLSINPQRKNGQNGNDSIGKPCQSLTHSLKNVLKKAKRKKTKIDSCNLEEKICKCRLSELVHIFSSLHTDQILVFDLFHRAKYLALLH